VSSLLILLVGVGLLPLSVGSLLLAPSPRKTRLAPRLGSVLLCALAFNLTFFWQELWLVIPKALTPGLHPILYHNNHDWVGEAPNVELLQGTGALATLASGLAFLSATLLARRVSAIWGAFFFWMAFQGLYQSLTQVVIGTFLPGNDVGRALAHLHLDVATRWAIFSVAVIAMGFVGVLLSRTAPCGNERQPTTRTRAFGYEILFTVVVAVALIVPFRLPRNFIEVVFLPLFVSLVGAGWLTLGAAISPRFSENRNRPGIIGPAVALGVTLLVFQLVLRPGIAF
jgi:hypothetical protein